MLIVTTHLFFLNILLHACSSQAVVAEVKNSDQNKSTDKNEKTAIKSDYLKSGMITNPAKTYVIEFLSKKSKKSTFVIKNLKNNKIVYKETTDQAVSWYDNIHISVGNPSGTIQANSTNNARGYLINILTGKKIWRN